jgi:hypothetical protein
MLGDETRTALIRMVDETMGDAMQARVGAFRDELVGTKARTAIDALITDLFSRAGAEWDVQLAPRVQKEEAKIQTRLHVVLFVAGGIVLALLFVAWFLHRRGKKYRSLVKLLTVTIDAMPNTAAYEGLTHEVSREAKMQQLEPMLRRILIEQGINDQEPPVDRAA